MAKQQKTQDAFIGLLMILALPVFFIAKVADAIGPSTLIGIPILIGGVVLLWLRRRHALRVAHLRSKYQDEVVVSKILNRTFWHGQTAEQLNDSMGRPRAVDNARLKTKKREVWKYTPNGRNRYRLRITLENDVVTGWDQKN